MDPSLMMKIKLERTSALVAYLSKYGKIMRKPLRATEPHEVSVSREMSMLHCSIVVPMVCGGRLEGLLALGGKITGDALTNEELELIYMISNSVIAIINDYRLHHEIQRQGDFIANILANMNSGVITIDAEQKISVVNKKASEILALDGDKLIGKDLRNIPSPLGDILFETLSMGSIFNRYEATLGASKTQLGINSYTLNNQNGAVVGSGIIFSDISGQKRLDSEKRKADRFQLINMLSGKIAHEIKNPLSTIQTFTQLLQEKYDDKDFRAYFIQTVLPSVSRLNNLIDKIIIFSNPLDFTPEPCDLSIIIIDAVDRIREELPFSRLSRGAPPPIQINADAGLLFKGIYYLLYTCCESAREGSPIEIGIHPAPGGLIAVTTRFTAIGNMIDITDEPLQVLEMDSLGVDFDVHVVRKIIEEHNGKLEIRHPDGMTEFVFLLPTIQQIKNQQEVG
jgi:nitrogen-specific signal transduction histidine kinase